MKVIVKFTLDVDTQKYCEDNRILYGEIREHVNDAVKFNTTLDFTDNEWLKNPPNTIIF